MKQVAVIGGAREKISGEDLAKAREVGRELAERRVVVLTGATSGLPKAAARGAKEAGGLSIGICPAESREEHLKRYRASTGEYHALLFTGFGWLGRNMVLVRSADAVISIGGGIGTLTEFVAACHAGKPIGVLEGTNGVGEKMREVVKSLSSNEGAPLNIVYSKSPKQVVARTCKMI